ncbi:MAG: FAD-dependent oxidoreductase, partial [Rhodospirillaceae bacterium]|nr:FAD-dependent oxidoreductase [Rhodospirillaceae bacterium]
SISEVISRDKRVTEIRTNRGPFRADAYVLALGSYTPLVLDEAGLRLPVYPAKGYSVSLTVVDAVRAPTAGLIDDERKHVYSRLGEDIRIAGMAEFTGFDTQINDQRARQLVSAAPTCSPARWTWTRPVSGPGYSRKRLTAYRLSAARDLRICM